MNQLGQKDLEWTKSIKTRMFDQFSHEGKDEEEFQLQKFLCKFVNGSCVFSNPGPRNVCFTVGVLGQFVGMLNVPARTKDFSIDDNHDIRYAVVLQNGKVFRMPFSVLMRQAYEHIGGKAGTNQDQHANRLQFSGPDNC